MSHLLDIVGKRSDHLDLSLHRPSLHFAVLVAHEALNMFGATVEQRIDDRLGYGKYLRFLRSATKTSSLRCGIRSAICLFRYSSISQATNITQHRSHKTGMFSRPVVEAPW